MGIKQSRGYYTGDLLPDKMEILGLCPYETYFRASVGEMRGIFRFVGYRARKWPDWRGMDLLYGLSWDGEVVEFQPMETFSDIRPGEIERYKARSNQNILPLLFSNANLRYNR